jgi:hypothetical protein
MIMASVIPLPPSGLTPNVVSIQFIYALQELSLMTLVRALGWTRFEIG